MSSEAYERERQNNSRLEDLAGKVSALRGVTIDIYDNARNHELIDRNDEAFTSFGAGLKNSANRLGHMARAGNKVAVFKLAAIVCGAVIVLWWISGFFF
ncbi:hypothetical protein EJ06DRAFT_544923 [Trichodelitschia bisporula]|uniref:t-SNARE coiled-coil homology domain-containing protein n=1 Tax=Trichodelitschia bisporula TaxID=703511 RepID=A0A6G1HLZ0_9PEZI|nr:hypothetical protein EJ06DRAFT_544923 [Trichodelitschia bisporula]